jgi:hypothetical protein
VERSDKHHPSKWIGRDATKWPSRLPDLILIKVDFKNHRKMKYEVLDKRVIGMCFGMRFFMIAFR